MVPAVRRARSLRLSDMHSCRDEVRRDHRVSGRQGPAMRTRLPTMTHDTASRTLACLRIGPDADYGAWSSRRGNPRAYPPFGTPRARTVWLAAAVHKERSARNGSRPASASGDRDHRWGLETRNRRYLGVTSHLGRLVAARMWFTARPLTAQPGRSSGRFLARWPCSTPVAWPTSIM